MTLTMII